MGSQSKNSLCDAEQLRVVELTSGVAASYAAKLFGDFGADVIKVEPETGDPMRHWDSAKANSGGFFSALNINKSSVRVDISKDSQALSDLLAWADILIHGYDRNQAASSGLDQSTLSQTHPGLVTLCITAFGHSGPHADFQGCELIHTSAGGWANLCPATHTDPSLPPLKVYGEQCSLMAAIAGATSALACLRDAQLSGVGEYIDLSVQEYVASVLEAGIPAYAYRAEVITRNHPRSLIPWRIFHAKDAPVFIVCVEQDQWERLVEFMGNPDWAALEIFADQPARAENQDMVHMFVQDFVSQWQAEELYHAAQQHRICIAPVLSLSQISRDKHLRERNFFIDIAGTEHLAGAIINNGRRAPVRTSAPDLGQDQQRLKDLNQPRLRQSSSAPDAPLAGVRVLDMTWAWAGPFCGLNLAHLGAEVIRIESDQRPDLYRRLPFYDEDIEPTLNSSGMFNQWNQGKFSIGMNLNQPAAIELVKDLVRHSDVVVQNFATGVMERMGLGFDTLKELNPKIVLASISGYGQTGPYKDYMGYGPAMPPLTGLAAATGYMDSEPEELGLSMPDPTAGITAAWAVVGALHQAARGADAQHLDISLWEATGVLNAEGWMHYLNSGEEPQRRGNRSTRMAPHGIFPCNGDDHWVAIACRDNEEWARLAALLPQHDNGVPDFSELTSLALRQQHEEAIESAICQWTQDQDRWAVTQSLQALGIPAFPTLSCADIIHDKHLNERGFVERLQHPEVGVRTHAGIPWRMLHRNDSVTRPAPCLGHDTRALLGTILGLSTDQLQTLHAQGVISQ